MGYVIRDLGSKNGVFVNGMKIQLETELKKGDEVLLGSTRIIFDQEAATRIEMVEGPPGLGAFNTIIGVRDILKKPVVEKSARPPASAGGLRRLRRTKDPSPCSTRSARPSSITCPWTSFLDHIMDLISQNIPMDRGVLMLKEGDPAQLIPKVDYTSGSIRLAPGDLLCLFTDGITEGRKADREDFGEERLLALLRENTAIDARAVMAKIFEEVRGFTGRADPSDDMTLVLVRRSG